MVHVSTADYIREQRRDRVWTLLVAGTKPENIAKALNISISTVKRDINSLKNKGQEWVFDLAKKGIAMEFKRCIDNIDAVINYCSIVMNTENPMRDSPQWAQMRPETVITQNMKMRAAELRMKSAQIRDEMLRNGPNVLAVGYLNDRVEDLEKQMGVIPKEKVEVFPKFTK